MSTSLWNSRSRSETWALALNTYTRSIQHFPRLRRVFNNRYYRNSTARVRARVFGVYHLAPRGSTQSRLDSGLRVFSLWSGEEQLAIGANG
eukprot:scaffold5173_cov39-Tisochrysis_lutea.AAC.1